MASVTTAGTFEYFLIASSAMSASGTKPPAWRYPRRSSSNTYPSAQTTAAAARRESRSRGWPLPLGVRVLPGRPPAPARTPLPPDRALDLALGLAFVRAFALAAIRCLRGYDPAMRGSGSGLHSNQGPQGSDASFRWGYSNSRL